MPPPESLRALLAGAVDYAGLFPPARLDLRSAAAGGAAVTPAHSLPCAA
jgi:hypothetical protein